MWADLIYEIRCQFNSFRQTIKTREFWIYFILVLLFVVLAVAGVWISIGYDPLTRQDLSLNFSCQTSEAKLAVIIIGGIIFCLTCLFTLGEVIECVEQYRQSKVPGSFINYVNYRRAVISVVFTCILGLAGFAVMRIWCG